MTEAEWLASDEPVTLLDFVRNRMTARKSRLLAAAFCRHVLPLVNEGCCQRAIDIAERYADELASLDEMLAVSEEVADAYLNCPNPAPANTEAPLSFKAESIAIQSARFLTRDIDSFLFDCCRCTELATLRWALLLARPDEEIAWCSRIQWQLLLIKDVVGDPFRPVPLSPAWRSATVVALAQNIYAERAFDRLPILADALEDAGCTNCAILDHCRQPGEHVRGCWVVDLVLGKQ